MFIGSSKIQSCSKYYTQYWYPRLELDDQLIQAGKKYFDRWNEKLKLPVYFVITSPLPTHVLGVYKSHWRALNLKTRFGEILIDVEKHETEEELFETIRHEIVHAVCDLRYNIRCGHTGLFLRLGKLMRVNVKRYEKNCH